MCEPGIDNHVPEGSAGWEVLTPEKPSELRMRLLAADLDDPEVLKGLITDISVLLMSHDTNTYYGRDFAKSFFAVKTLLGWSPNIDGGEQHWQFKTIGNPGMGGSLHISAREDAEVNPTFNHETEARADRIVIHVHMDTVSAEHVPQPITHRGQDEVGELLVGLGACDMKSQLAVAIVLMEKLRRNGTTGVELVITSDEEIAGMRGGADHLKRIVGDALLIELEPTGQYPNTPVKHIRPSVTYSKALPEGSCPRKLAAWLKTQLNGSPNHIVFLGLKEPQLIVSTTQPLRNLGELGLTESYSFEGWESTVAPATMALLLNILREQRQVRNGARPSGGNSNGKNHRTRLHEYTASIPLRDSETGDFEIQDLIWNYAVMAVMAELSNVIIIGPREAFGGRHNYPYEGVYLSELVDLYKVLSEFVMMYQDRQDVV